MTKNADLLQKLAEKDQEIVAVSSRFKQMKTKTANGILKDEMGELQKKLEERQKQVNTLK